MSDMERSGPDDVEGHYRSRQDTEAGDETAVALDDVEGHRVTQDTEAGDEDVEGHALRSQDQDRKAATDDVEGHSWR